MGKKTKVGKQRKDKYYQLAKETGYRSRAAFKLIQLNRKFGFLQKSRVCIDLCAAPGGWMQVAQQNMPLSSVVIGVDLFPIKAVPGCISLTEDITTEKCKTAISKEIKTWKADVVLNDGAPNVGLNWLHDAYQQATLTLSALKLATQFLREGGWFVTKVFRSKDYHPLIWVFKQLFKKVHATKPQASRNESSEIFVVCQGYLAPDSIDPKFLDHKYVFEDFEVGNKNRFNLLHPEKAKKAKAEGYEENDYTQHHQVPVSHFLKQEDPIDALRGCSQIVIDDASVAAHERTTQEILECCRDIKVLGRKDLKSLLNWLKHMKEFKTSQDPKEQPLEESADAAVDSDKDDSDKEEDKIDEQIAEIQEEERRQSRRKRKQLNKQRQRLAEKMNLKMVLKGDDGPVLEANDMFQLKDIKDATEMKSIMDQAPDILAERSDSDDELKVKAKFMKYDVEESKLDKSGVYYRDSDSELEIESDSEKEEKEGLGFSDSEDEQKKLEKVTKKNTAKNSKKKKSDAHPLLTDLEEPASRRSVKAELWFQKDSLKDLNEDDDEDVDLDKLADSYKKKGKTVSASALTDYKKGDGGAVGSAGKMAKKPMRDSGVSSDSDGDTSDSDYDLEETVQSAGGKAGKSGGGAEGSKSGGGAKGSKSGGGAKSGNTDDFEVVKQDKDLKSLKRTLKMDGETLALGSMVAASKKFRRDLRDDAWNRYMFQDTGLPDWFVEDESKNMRRPVAIPEKEAEEYKKRLQEINARPIKKVVEARARKKKRMVKKMERAKKKVEAVLENGDMSEREKAKQVKQLYRKAGTEAKPEIKYVVARKHTTAKRMKRPAGVKGRYRVVDPRMKKDMRAQKAKEKTQGRKKSKGPVRNKAKKKTK